MFIGYVVAVLSVHRERGIDKYFTINEYVMKVIIFVCAGCTLGWMFLWYIF